MLEEENELLRHENMNLQRIVDESLNKYQEAVQKVERDKRALPDLMRLHREIENSRAVSSLLN
jgi:hypothetical protein